MKTRPSALALVSVILCAISLGACSAGPAASATPSHVPSVALMHVGTDHNPPSLATLVAALHDMGWFDESPSQVMQLLIGDGTKAQGRMKQLQGQFAGQRIKLIWRNLDTPQEYTQAEEFVRQRVDVIVAFEDKSIGAARDATADPAHRIPVVFLHPSDPLRDHLVQSLSSPGGNLTGVWGARDPLAKQLEIYRQILPPPKPLRLLTLTDPSETATTITLLPEARDAARKLGITLDEVDVADDAGIRAAFKALAPGAVDGVFILSPDLRLFHSGTILALAAAAHLPVQAHRREWVDPKGDAQDKGALFSLGVDVGPVGTAGARFVDSILKGTPPGDLPAQEVPEVEFALSLRRAADLGIKVPKAVELQADPVYR